MLSKAAVALKAWMVANDKTQTDIALALTEKFAEFGRGRSDRTPVNQSTISSWCRGATEPSGVAMVTLQKLTNDAVLVTDWIVPADVDAARQTGT